MTPEQIIAVRCAMADLLHVYLEPEHCDIDWKSIKETIFDMSEVFPFLEEEFADRIDKITNGD